MSREQENAGYVTESVEVPGRSMVLLILLSTWIVANGLTHTIVLILTGGIYYQLPFPLNISAEASISLLNFLLPVLATRYILKEPLSFAGSFSWMWTGWKIPVLACCGFIVYMLVCNIGNWFFDNNMISYGAPGLTGPVTRLDYLIFVLILLIFPALGEETMFRGFLQTRLTAIYGKIAGILVPAALFAIRHHPTDIYFGIVNHTPLAGWANRAFQLYIFAIILGLVRHFSRSTWASWIIHIIIIFIIIIKGGFLRVLLS